MTKQEFLSLNAYSRAKRHAPKFTGTSKRVAKNKRFSVFRKSDIRKRLVISTEIACPWLAS